MTIEEKAKAYDKVRKKIAIRFGSNVADEFFAEFEESEDEKIRKRLITDFGTIGKKEWGGLEVKDILAWLKKQGEKKPVDTKSVFEIGETITDGTSTFTIVDIKDENYITDDGDKVCFYVAHKYYIPFKEQKPTDKVEPKFKVGDRVRYKGHVCDGVITEITDTDYICGNAKLPISTQDKLELIEQKPADTVELKFKVGDWIVENGVNRNPVQITSFEEDKGVGIKVWFSNGTGTYVEFLKGYHKWTIQDAKDGDVLCCESGWTCIFKALDNHTNTFSSYCFMDNNKWFCDTGSECHTQACIKSYHGEIHPATKEQCTELFLKMYEAGYKWDDENKELIGLELVEQKSAWSEEDKDEKIRNWLIKYFNKADFDGMLEYVNGIKAEDILAWLEKQKIIDVLDEEERKFADDVDSYRKDMDEFYKKGYNAGREAEKQDWLEKQKPTDVLPIFRVGDELCKKNSYHPFFVERIVDGYYCCNSQGEYFPIEEQTEWDLVEKKQAWTEEDESCLDTIISEIQSNKKEAKKYEHKTYDGLIDWLKSFKTRISGWR